MWTRNYSALSKPMMLPDSTHGHGRGWPVSLMERLKELWLLKTPSQIGEALGITRNAVIGKANRMGLPRKQQAGERKKLPKPIVRIKHIVKFAAASPPPPLDQPQSLNLTIYDLGEGQCRYPHGETPPYFFCGQPVQEYSSYCPFHHRLCNYPVSPARRDTFDGAQWRGVR
jgi:GcrA cell cycle regulator